MQKIIIRYGIINSALIAVLLFIGVLLMKTIGVAASEIFGFAAMAGAFVTIFSADFAYRKEQPGASFGKYLIIGLAITVMASIVYAVVWLFLYYTIFPDFIDQYGKMAIDRLKANGASDKDILAKMNENAHFKDLYKNPLSIIGLTFLEPFPVGVVMSLAAALVARMRKG